MQITNERDKCPFTFALPSNTKWHKMLSVRIHRGKWLLGNHPPINKANSKWQEQNKAEMKVNTGNTQLCSYTVMKIDDIAEFICAVFVYVANPGHGYSTSLIK